jgi:hypothetical protein
MTKTEKIKSNENASMIADELDKVSAISAIYDMKGGKILMKALMSDVVNSIDTLCYKYQTLTNQEFVGLCANIKTKLDLVKTLRKSVEAKKQATEDLENALLEIDN